MKTVHSEALLECNKRQRYMIELPKKSEVYIYIAFSRIEINILVYFKRSKKCI